MPSIHNPTNFRPEDYEVIDYLDNRRPPYIGEGQVQYETLVRDWEENFKRIYGPEWRNKIHHCVHCGNGNVRFIIACKHLPTGEVVTFGNECVARLNFRNHEAFRMAQLVSQAQLRHQRMKIYVQYNQFVEEHPEVLDYIDAVENEEIHSRNTFAHSILRQLRERGRITDNQLNALAASLQRDRTRSEARRDLDERLSNSEYVGIEGATLWTMLKVTQHISFNTAYGEATMHIMEDPFGNQIRWTSTGRNNLEVGGKFFCSMQVKRHQLYRGTKQTIVRFVKKRLAVTDEEFNIHSLHRDRISQERFNIELPEQYAITFIGNREPSSRETQSLPFNTQEYDQANADYETITITNRDGVQVRIPANSHFKCTYCERATKVDNSRPIDFYQIQEIETTIFTYKCSHCNKNTRSKAYIATNRKSEGG